MPVPRLPWMMPLTLCLLAAAVSADEPPPFSAQPPAAQEPPRVSAPPPTAREPLPPAGPISETPPMLQILSHMESSRVDHDWLAFHLNHLHLQKQHGFAYTRNVEAGANGMEFSVQGPALGRNKMLGLNFELRF